MISLGRESNTAGSGSPKVVKFRPAPRGVPHLPHLPRFLLSRPVAPGFAASAANAIRPRAATA